MLELPPCRDEQFGVFTAAQAHDWGMTRHQLAGGLRSGRLYSLRRGVYVDKRAYDAASPADRSKAVAVAACLARPGSVVSHHSAALIHGLPLLGSRPALPAITISPSTCTRNGRDRGVVVHAAGLPAAHVLVGSTWSLTAVSRTLADLGRDGAFVTALVALDAALHRGRTTQILMRNVSEVCGSWPRGGRLRDLVKASDRRAESPYETLARWQLRQLGHCPTPQVWAYDRNGPIGPGDLWLDPLWTYLEVDGDVKYSVDASPSTLVEEKHRQERLESAGFGVARIAARDVRNFRLLEERVARASRRGQLERQTSHTSLGFVGPPPSWAIRGADVAWKHPPDMALRPESRIGGPGWAPSAAFRP